MLAHNDILKFDTGLLVQIKGDGTNGLKLFGVAGQGGVETSVLTGPGPFTTLAELQAAINPASPYVVVQQPVLFDETPVELWRK